MKTAAAVMLAVLVASRAPAQSVATELDITGGYSTEGIAAGAAQVRVLGDAVAGIRFFSELSWAARSEDEGDVFGGAYPYGNRIDVVESYVERLFRPGRALVGVRAGRYRSPFGIYGRSDHAYAGFLRPPMIRYDDYFAISNNFLEHGAAVVAGVPQAFVEASVGVPGDISEEKRRPGADTVIRGQAYFRSLIVGVSYFRSQPYMPAAFALGHMVFTGVDARWTSNGVQLRGEWIAGRPFDGVATRGGYLDASMHRPGMGPVTAVARIERLHYDTVPRHAISAQRATVAARVRLPLRMTAQIAADHQWGRLIQRRPTTLGLALTYSLRYDSPVRVP
jgi:hypothetical protein